LANAPNETCAEKRATAAGCFALAIDCPGSLHALQLYERVVAVHSKATSDVGSEHARGMAANELLDALAAYGRYLRHALTTYQCEVQPQFEHLLGGLLLNGQSSGSQM
jgi:hypothetical protein